MAMYENMGYCPANAFLHYEKDGNNVISPLWKRTKEILGDRIGYMVYSEAGFDYKCGCYVVDALEGATGTLGIEIATALKQLIPICKYGEAGRQIVCTDLINPYQIPAKIINVEEVWSCNEQDTILFDDERYLFAIQDNGKKVHMYLYKK